MDASPHITTDGAPPGGEPGNSDAMSLVILAFLAWGAVLAYRKAKAVVSRAFVPTALGVMVVLMLMNQGSVPLAVVSGTVPWGSVAWALGAFLCILGILVAVGRHMLGKVRAHIVPAARTNEHRPRVRADPPPTPAPPDFPMPAAEPFSIFGGEPGE